MDEVTTRLTDTDPGLYEADEHAWIERQISFLRDGDLRQLDREHLIAFLSNMAARDRRELESWLTVLYAHVLKFQLQPERATRSWRLTVAEQQRPVRRMVELLPSLDARADEILISIYPHAVKAALIETNADERDVPPSPLLDMRQLLSFDAGRG